MTSWEACERGGKNGKAVQIVGVTETGLQLKKEVLEGILQSVPADLPLAVLSIGGEYRTGKSFFLNYFRLCLLNQVHVFDQ